MRLERDALAHQREMDRRQQWWVRAQWAVDKSLSADPVVRDLGVETLQLLADEPADRVDLAVLLLAVRRAVDPADFDPADFDQTEFGTGATWAHTGQDPDPEGARRVASTTSRDTSEARHDASVSAARAVIKISTKLGLPVEPEIARLAAEKQFRERRYERLAAGQAGPAAPDGDALRET